MESPINSSFIPTKISLGERPREEYGSDAFDVVVLLGVIALVVAGTMAAGVFLYKQFATNELATKKTQLNKAKEAFQPNLVRDLSRLDERLSIAEGILQGHLAPSAFFDVLQQTTLKTIQFQNMNFTMVTGDKIHVKMEGKAASVNGIAYQATVFGSHPAIKNPIFTVGGITKDGVDFNVEFDVNPEAVNFASLVGAAAAASDTQQEGFVPNNTDDGTMETGDGQGINGINRGVPQGGGDVGLPVKTTPQTNAKKKQADSMFGDPEE